MLLWHEHFSEHKGDLCNVVVFLRMWMKVEGVKITKQNWYGLNTWGTVQFIEGRKNVFFSSYTADWSESSGITWHTFESIPSYSVVPVWEKERERKEKWSVALVQTLLQRQCHTCWVSGPSANLAHANINTECRNGSRSNTVASSSRLPCNSKHYFCCLLWW